MMLQFRFWGLPRRVFGSLRTRRLLRMRAFGERYGDWRAALPDACAAMFSLNRAAKHPGYRVDRLVIYGLKDGLIELLHGTPGFCVGCFRHLVRYPCWSCDGAGCGRCGGNGVHHILGFICFQFVVRGQAYCWHQPESLVRFPVRFTEEAKYWDGGAGEKPVGMRRAKFAEAKDLVRWVLARAAAERAVAA